ncbi:MAG: hypothetical protein MJ237_08715 [bacterium]|nr:hypothetical protein [bacterium]
MVPKITIFNPKTNYTLCSKFNSKAKTVSAAIVEEVDGKMLPRFGICAPKESFINETAGVRRFIEKILNCGFTEEHIDLIKLNSLYI